MAWLKKSPGNPQCGFQGNAKSVPQASCRTAQQKRTNLKLMLGQVVNYCPIISRKSIVKNLTSMSSIWQAIHLHYGFRSTGTPLLDFNNIKLAPDKHPEDLYQCLMSFIDDNLLSANSSISHHGEVPGSDEEMSPTPENLVVLTWLRLVHIDLPSLIKQHYSTELRSRSLASLKPEISQALDSLLEEIHTTADTKILGSTALKLSVPSKRAPYRKTTKACNVVQSLVLPLVQTGWPQ